MSDKPATPRSWGDAHHEEGISYLVWLDRISRDGVTPPLAEYLRWVGYDGDLPLRLETVHLVNLLDQAVEALEAAYGSTNALREVLEQVLGAGERTEEE